MKKKIILWLIKILDDNYIPVRKARLDEIIYMANKLPKSKIVTLSLIRLDGSDIKTALDIWDKLQ